MISGLSLDYRLGDTLNRTSVMSQAVIIEEHASNGKGVTVRAPTSTLDHDIYISLSDRWRLNAGLGLTFYDLGTGLYGTYRSNLGLKSNAYLTNVDLQLNGRLSSDTPLWLPQAEHSGSLSVNQGLSNGSYYIGLNGRKSFENLGRYYIGLSVGGEVGGK